MGDPCGIGPEIIAKLFAAHLNQEQMQRAVVVGDVSVMRRAVQQSGLLLPVVPLATLNELSSCPPQSMPVIAASEPLDLTQLTQGHIHSAAGHAAAQSIRLATQWAMEGNVRAIVTAPLHKEALAAAGEPFPGHTELLQSLAHGVPVRMMLANEALKTVLVSIHVPLRQAIDMVTVDNVLSTILIAHQAAQRWGQPNARIAVAGLNPHAGEGGLFGEEDLRHIAPAIAAARAQGINASGPYAPDTVFMRARHTDRHPGEFDIVIAMYHDQGLIPVKYLGLDEGVNVTLGLPFVRTSPDHGTAFDIAGKNVASPSSLWAAWKMADQLSALP